MLETKVQLLLQRLRSAPAVSCLANILTDFTLHSLTPTSCTVKETHCRRQENRQLKTLPQLGVRRRCGISSDNPPCVYTIQALESGRPQPKTPSPASQEFHLLSPLHPCPHTIMHWFRPQLSQFQQYTLPQYLSPNHVLSKEML